MKISRSSFFKDKDNDIQWFENWVSDLEELNKRKFERTVLKTSLGKTLVFSLNKDRNDLETLVIFPGARTSVLFWDFDRGLDNLRKDLRIFLVETNGLPNLSDGDTPDIKSDDYGVWASELFELLNIDEAFIAGASFGGLICMKLCRVNPDKVKAAFLLNPGCLQPFSMTGRNLYFNLLPIIFPKRRNITKFLDNAVFCKPVHKLSEASEKLITDYELFAITRYKDKTQKPYYMNDELTPIKTPVYLLVGNRDLLFPFQTSIDNAKKKLSSLKEVKVFENVAHGIETYGDALKFIERKISELKI
ncbi:MAG: alpha/beta hydrolase [bacterium]